MLLALFLLMFSLTNSYESVFYPSSVSHADVCQSTWRITSVFRHFEPFFEIVLLTDGRLRCGNLEVHYFRKCLMERYPSVTIDYRNVSLLTVRAMYSVFGSPRLSTFFVMIQPFHRERTDENLRQFGSVLEEYVKVYTRPIRPRWLSIYVTESRDSSDDFRELLTLAWRNKFLDFTILEATNSEIYVHSYNPFSNETSLEILDDDKNLFPDKLHNLHGYPLKTMFVHEPPGIIIPQSKDGQVAGIRGPEYQSLKTISELLNFTLLRPPEISADFVFNRNRTSFNVMYQAILDGEIDFSGNDLYFMGLSKLARSFLLSPDGHCALVPVIWREKFHVPKSFYMGMEFILVYVGILTLAAKLLKFDRKIWTWITMIQFFLGVPAVRQPPLLKERVLMGVVIMLAVFYLTDLYVKMMDVELTFSAKPLDTFEELDASGLTPLVYPPLYNKTFDHSLPEDNQVIQRLKRKTRFWNEQLTCADQLVKEDVTSFCIMSEKFGRAMVRKFKKRNGKLRVKLTKSCFWMTWRGRAFSPGSPYVEKFDKVLVRVVESGLLRMWLPPAERKSFTKKKRKRRVSDITLQLNFVLGVGYLISCAAFLGEYIHHARKSKKVARKPKTMIVYTE